MPNDDQPAKSYIETVLARADAATPGFGADHDYWAYRSNNGTIQAGDGDIIAYVTRFKDGVFFRGALRDTRTLAKIALRAIEALEASSLAVRQGAAGEVPEIVASALADINALAAKGSQ